MHDSSSPRRDTGLTRRELLGGIALGCTVVAGSGLGLSRAAAAPAKGRIVLPPLPWAETALQPTISARTIGFHHGKHHRAYVTKTVALIQGTDLEKLPLAEIVRRTAGRPERAAIFDNAAQVWNHSFYWSSLRPKPAAPSGALLRRLGDLGGVAGAKKELVQAGLAQFGSGWAWLVSDGGKLKVVKTPNAETPLTTGATPLLCIDVWEHAYYLDYQNRRGDYLTAVVDHVLDWGFAAKNLRAAKR
jgi:Fe-Mn family superoxide dismutase